MKWSKTEEAVDYARYKKGTDADGYMLGVCAHVLDVNTGEEYEHPILVHEDALLKGFLHSYKCMKQAGMVHIWCISTKVHRLGPSEGTPADVIHSGGTVPRVNSNRTKQYTSGKLQGVASLSADVLLGKKE